MLLLVALLACSDPRPDAPGPPTVSKEELTETWEGIPLKRGQWPAWLPDGVQKHEAVTELDNGKRSAVRIAAPMPGARDQGDGDASWGVQEQQWQAKLVPEEGPVRTWRLSFDPDPERIAGTPLRLSPSGAEVVAVVEPALVRGVLDLGHQAFGFQCLGADADLSPDGWCLTMFSQLYAESWSE